MTQTINKLIRQTITNPFPTIRGNAPRNEGATVYITADGVTFTTTVVDGKWSWQTESALDEGDHVFSFFLVDRAGNVGPSSQYLLTLDTLPPDAPVILQASDDFGASTGILRPGETTDDKTPTLKGSAEPNSTVKIYAGDKLVGETTADRNGLWQLEVELENGTHELRAEAIDSVNHVSDKSDPFMLTVNAPAEGIDNPPVLNDIWDDVGPGIGAISQDGHTNDNMPTFSGTGIAGETVIIFDNGSAIGSAGVDASGDWRFTPATGLPDGDHVITVAHQGSEKTSPAWAFNVDTQRPDVPNPGINALLQDASEGMFIENGKTQLLLNSDEVDLAPLHAMLNAADSCWEQQAGSVTVGGQQYQVYSQTGCDTELLMPETIKNELA